MATFILVHGSLHGGWCWQKVARRLNESGHKALTPDLPGMGSDRTPPEDVTLALTGGTVADLARREDERVVLVGHSLGGIAISDAAERAPEAIGGLIYVTALMFPSGTAAMDVLMRNGKLPEGIIMSSDGAVITIDPGCARERYYKNCKEDDVRMALASLTPQPTRPMHDRLVLTPERFGSIPRAYIECLRDNALSLEFQRSQREVMPCHTVFTMNTGHSPFFQAPEELSEHLMSAAALFQRICDLSGSRKAAY